MLSLFPWNSLVCGPAPQVYFWFFVYAGLLPALHYRLIAMAFWGGLAFKARLVAPPATPFVLPGKSAIGSTTALALAAPLKFSP
jgi:hypothetical protein